MESLKINGWHVCIYCKYQRIAPVPVLRRWIVQQQDVKLRTTLLENMHRLGKNATMESQEKSSGRIESIAPGP